MSKLNTAPRKFTTHQTMVTIVNPELDVNTREFEFRGFYRSDFIDVPRLATHGEWRMSELIPAEQLVHLAVLAKAIPDKRSTYSDRWHAKHAAQVAERQQSKAKGKGARRGA
jgi:hypothetical protein